MSFPLWVLEIDNFLRAFIDIENEFDDAEVGRHVDQKFAKHFQIVGYDGHDNLLTFSFI